MSHLTIEESHFQYLVLQNGMIDEYKHNRADWEEAYNSRLEGIASNIAEWLPKNRPYRILDIGSGLGGIHIKLKKLNPQVMSYLFDGENDPPEMKNHDRTFNNMYDAEDFLRKNGVRAGWFTPKDPPKGYKFDVVTSFQSWCFHYNPEVYIDLVKEITEPGSKIIVDMRSDYKTWQRVMKEEFGEPTVIFEDRKWFRCVYFIK